MSHFLFFLFWGYQEYWGWGSIAYLVLFSAWRCKPGFLLVLLLLIAWLALGTVEITLFFVNIK